jgi:hypothetical protein
LNKSLHKTARPPIKADLFEGNANSLFASPHDSAWMLIVMASDFQNEIIGNAKRTGDIKTGTGGR